MTDTELTLLFQQWWRQSYPTPPGQHALATHVGWGRYLLERVQGQQQREQER
jgi:hypothetical protein